MEKCLVLDEIVVSPAEKIRKYIADHNPSVGIEDLRTDEPLAGIIDSLAVLGLIGFIEPEFSIEISPSDVTDENFATIGTIADLVERLTKSKS
jgi:acyl carrier protein